MRHPDWDKIKIDFVYIILYKSVCMIDKVINFFDHTYATAEEGMGMFSVGNTMLDRTFSSGRLEVYNRRYNNMPKYQEVPFVRIVTNNAKWDHDTSRYNDCSVPVSISEDPKPLKKYRLKKGDISEERFQQYLRFIACNKDLLLKIWYEGYSYKEEFKDPEKMFYNKKPHKKKTKKE